jgi:hypothetical protein
MVGGTAAAVGHHMATKSQQEAQQNQQIQELQEQQYQQQAPQPAAAAPAAPAAGGTDIASELTKLKGLLDQGVLTQEEFDQAKQKLLSS